MVPKFSLSFEHFVYAPVHLSQTIRLGNSLTGTTRAADHSARELFRTQKKIHISTTFQQKHQKTKKKIENQLMSIAF